MPRAEVSVRSPGEANPGSDILLQRGPDRLVHQEAKLRQEPIETPVVPSNGKGEGPVGEHGSP
jgi:hypothetical protein